MEKSSFIVKHFILIQFILFWTLTNAQISIVSANFNYYNITPSSMVDLQIMNSNLQNTTIIAEAKLFSSQNELLISVKTNPIILKQGLNSGLNAQLAYANYSGNKYSEYIKTSKMLPAGKYRYCATIITVNGSEPQSDDYCDELEAENYNLLYLISVPDKEELETSFPVLTWYHSESFNLLAQNESYRLVLTEIKKDQTPDAAITVNNPVYLKTSLNSHTVQYPLDAPKLESGKHYAWQVQKISNGVIIDKTETWEFSIAKPTMIEPVKYAVVQKYPKPGFYEARAGKIFFRYEENYLGNSLNYRIKNDKNEYLDVKIKPNDIKNSGSQNVISKSSGSNYYEINLEKEKLSKGFYWLEINNEKGDVYKLKFLIGDL